MATVGEVVAAAPADDMPLSAYHVAEVKVVYVGPRRDDLADELVPDHHRHRDGLLCPSIPVVDVQIRPADARLADADEDIVDADFGLGHILQPEAGFRLRFDEGFHEYWGMRDR